MYSRAKRRAHQIVNSPEEGGRASRMFDQAIFVLIGLTSLAIILETIAPIKEAAAGAFDILEIVTVAIFTVEYVLRLWSCTEDPDFSHPVGGRLRFAVQPLTLIDLLAIVPFYLPFVGHDLRMARVMRLLRLLKLTRYSESMSIIGDVLRSRREALISTLFVGFVLLLFASGLMYLAERDAAAGRVLEHPGGDVVGDGDADHGGIRRSVSGHPAGARTWGRGGAAGNRPVCAAGRNPGVGVRGGAGPAADTGGRDSDLSALRRGTTRRRGFRRVTVRTLLASGDSQANRVRNAALSKQP